MWLTSTYQSECKMGNTSRSSAPNSSDGQLPQQSICMAMSTIGLEPENMCKGSKLAYDYVTNIPAEFDYPQVLRLNSSFVMCSSLISPSISCLSLSIPLSHSLSSPSNYSSSLLGVLRPRVNVVAGPSYSRML